MLQIHERRQYQITAFSLTGQFTCRTVIDIQTMIFMAQKSGYHHIVLDFSSVTEIDSSSLNDFFLWYHDRRPGQVQISVVKPPPYIRYHKDWSHLSEIVSIFGSPQEALEYASSC